MIGLGYVGLPLAVAFGQHYDTLGFDIDSRRIRQLADGQDLTREVDEADLVNSAVRFSADAGALAEANIYIVTVPTPVTDAKVPDFGR